MIVRLFTEMYGQSYKLNILKTGVLETQRRRTHWEELLAQVFWTLKLIKKLMALVPGIKQFRQLQHIQASALVEGLGAQMADLAINILETAEQQFAATLQQKANAIIAYEDAIINEATEEVLQELKTAIDVANEIHSKASASIAAVGNFIKVTTDIANCQTRSFKIEK